MTRLSLSVVIPCFDYEQFVGEAIDSVLASSRRPDEIVVVDDGSSDGSAEVVAGYEAVTLVRKENGGMASALNRALVEATGDVVVLLDADDLMDTDRLAWVETAFADPAVVMAWHPLTIVDDAGATHGACPPTPLPAGDIVPGILAHGFTSFAVTSGVALRRSVLADLCPIPEDDFRNFAESYLVRAAPFHGRVAATDTSLGSYRSHAGSDMKSATSADPDQMAEKLARRLLMADTEQAHLCAQAVAAGHQLTLPQLRAHDAIYRDLFLAHARLAHSSRSTGWRDGRALDLSGAPLGVRVGAAWRLVTYVALPRSVVARHELVKSGTPGLGTPTRLWSGVYWRAKGLRARLSR